MILGIIIGIIVLIVAAALFVAAGYVKAPPDVAFVISGRKKEPRILVGKAGFKVPFFDRVDKLALGTVQIDVKTAKPVPTNEFINVRVDSNVNVKVGRTPEMIKLACENFLNVPRSAINEKVRDLLEGNIREIVGTMTLKDMVQDRKAFSEAVQANAVPDLARFGLELISFNVQNFNDDNSVIENLGIDNVEQIRKNAMIAKSNAQKEVAMTEARNAQEANEAKIESETEIARQNAELDKQKAALKQSVDIQKAKADAAKDIEAENQRKIREVAYTDANIAKTEREVELRQKEISLKEYELDAMVRKQADAEKYAAETRAQAQLIARQKEAEAIAYKVKQDAEAQKVKAEADLVAATKQAEAIKAIGEAEAAAIEKKAEAQKKMGEASVIEMYLKALPSIVASASGPLENVDSITMYGSGNTNALVGDIMKTVSQVTAGLKDSGIDFPALLSGIFKKD